MVTWGGWTSGAQRMRLGYEFSQSPSTISHGTTSATVTLRIYVQTNWGVQDSVNSQTVSGNFSASGSVNVSIPTGGGTQLLRTLTRTVSPSFTGTITSSFSASLSGIEAVPGTATVSGSHTTARRPIGAPAAPTNVSASRNSDTSTTVTWTRTNPTSSSNPYQSQRVQRRQYTTAGGWSAWVDRSGSLSASATSWTDTTAANWRYQYRVRAVNSAGSAVSSGSNTLSTTPSAPSNVTATKSGNNVVVTWTNTRRVAGGVEIQRQEDGGEWVAAATLSGSPTSWTHSNPDPGVTHRYRVAATVTGPSLQSAWATSNVVQLAAPPNAPTGLGPSTIRDATEDVTWHWTHNPVDSSEQERFELRHRVAGTSTWTTVGPINSNVSSWTLPGDTYPNPDTVEWQVRTWGQHANPSPWSATASSPTSARPTVVVNAPEEASTVEASAVTVEWGYADPEETDQQSWQVELRDASDEIVETRSGSGPAASVPLTTVLPDGTSWTVRVRARDGHGLWSHWDSATFGVEYPLPPTPTVSLTWDPDSASVGIEVDVPEWEEGQAEPVHVDVWRSIDEGPWVLIATGVPLGSTVTDWSPTVAGSNRYRADAVSALPSTATSAPVELVTPQPGDPPAVWLNGGPGFAQGCRLMLNVTITPTADRAVRVLHQFAGRPHPVEFTGDALTRTWQVSGTVLDGEDDVGSPVPEWLALAELPGPLLLRTRALGGVHALVSVTGMSTPLASNGVVSTVSFTATQVDDG